MTLIHEIKVETSGKAFQVGDTFYSDIIYLIRGRKIEIRRIKSEKGWFLSFSEDQDDEEIQSVLAAKGIDLSHSIDQIAQALYEHDAKGKLRDMQQLIDEQFDAEEIKEQNYISLSSFIDHVNECRVYCLLAGIPLQFDELHLSEVKRKIANKEAFKILQNAEEEFEKEQYASALSIIEGVIEIKDFVDEEHLEKLRNIATKSYGMLLEEIKKSNDCYNEELMKKAGNSNYLIRISSISDIITISEEDKTDVLFPFFNKYFDLIMTKIHDYIDNHDMSKRRKKEAVISQLFCIDQSAEFLGISSDRLKEMLNYDWLKPYLVPELFDRSAKYNP